MAEAARADDLERFQTDLRREYAQFMQFLLIHNFLLCYKVQKCKRAPARKTADGRFIFVFT